MYTHVHIETEGNDASMAGEPQTTRDIVRSLQEKIRGWERDHRAAAEIVSSGCPALDRLLADGGFCRGTLVEWLAPGEKTGGAHFRNESRPLSLTPGTGSDRKAAGPGCGAATLALAITARAVRQAGAI